MSTPTSTERPPAPDRTPEETPAAGEPAQDAPTEPVRVDEELRDSLAIRAVYRALDDVSGGVTEHSDRLSTLMFNTAHEFFDAAHAERCRLLFENAVKRARNIPDGAKAALLELHELYDMKQFDSYGRAGVIVGVAAGLRRLGAHYIEDAADRQTEPAKRATCTPQATE